MLGPRMLRSVLILARRSSKQGQCGLFRAVRRNNASASAAQSLSASSGPALNVNHTKFAIDDELQTLAKISGPLAAYEMLVEKGVLTHDDAQVRLLRLLNVPFYALRDGLDTRGLYIHGSVGCGKSMCMDLLNACLSGQKVLRVHFHEFMHTTHMELHKVKMQGAASSGSSSVSSPIEVVAEKIADEVDVLLFDEFAITSIQDCVLVAPMFRVLCARGVMIVATSNRAPEDLYENGLNRHMYLPDFIKTLRDHCSVVDMSDEATDYRAVKLANSGPAETPVFQVAPLNSKESEEFMDTWFQRCTGQRRGKVGIVQVAYGRRIPVEQIGDVGRFTFDELCRRELSADDFDILGRTFHTILLQDIPHFAADDHNESRRFTAFIDFMYQHHVRLVMTAEVVPEKIFEGLVGLRQSAQEVLHDPLPASESYDSEVQLRSGPVDADRKLVPHGKVVVSPSDTLAGKSVAVGSPARPHDMKASESGGQADIEIWRQGGADETSLPQVSRQWDSRRRNAEWRWESADATSEQKTIQGVMAAAVASLQESGFAALRTASRLQEMQTALYLEEHRTKRFEKVSRGRSQMISKCVNTYAE
eukprot:gnl/MRDRNA2_/MRDRNA2_105188_c0_seq1.p1 gnl/MRDRNA2_/MRDRNA2_105188_c0~~gnl/MRDRNA2_/MRDRNA2_105188_c0_seq1.p1  ORF type:complete len:590 (+),score=115.49 gnl/MRDRNA2_/MRDRNA2_105188_c0_seq1:87-1856(+)